MLVLYLPVTLTITLLTWPDQPVANSSWAALAWAAIMPQWLGFFAWNRGLALGGIARIGQVQLLQVFFTLGFAALLVGEKVSPVTWLFAAAVVLCVLMGRRTRVR